MKKKANDKRFCVYLLLILGITACLTMTTCGKMQEKPKEEYDQLVVSYLVSKKPPKDLEFVTERLNEILREKIGVEVSWHVVMVENQLSEYSSLISSGEPFDLACFAFQDMGELVRKGQLMDMTGLLKESGMEDFLENEENTQGGVYDGKIYGISRIHASGGAQSGFIIRKEYLDEIGHTPKEQYSFQEVEEIFEKIKKLHPSLYLCGNTEGDLLEGSSFFSYMHEMDVLGANVCSGVLMDVEKPEIVNLFETKEYYQFLKTMRRWHERGYLLPDAMTCDLSGDTLLRNSVTAGYFMNVSPYQLSNAREVWGGEFAGLPMTRPYGCGRHSSGGIYWSVPVSAKNPEAAIRLLDVMFHDAGIGNLLNYGVEDVHYEKKEGNQIRLLNVENYGGNGIKFMGDLSEIYQTGESVLMEDNAFTRECGKHMSIAAGYVYDPTDYRKEINEIQRILNDYLPVLETGSEKKLSALYQEFISKLKDAGIDAVIHDNQVQLEQWLEQSN